MIATRLSTRALALGALLSGALVLSACSWGTAPRYYEKTVRYTEKKATASRGFVGRYLERDDLVRVKAWERDLLARGDMAWNPDAAQSLRRSHIYFSKEASLGGGSAGGGGCGCN